MDKNAFGSNSLQMNMNVINIKNHIDYYSRNSKLISVDSFKVFNRGVHNIDKKNYQLFANLIYYQRSLEDPCTLNIEYDLKLI